MAQFQRYLRQQLMACLLLSEPLWKEFSVWLNKTSFPGEEEAGFRVWVFSINQYYRQWNRAPDLATLQALSASFMKQITPEESQVINVDCGQAASMASAWRNSDVPQEKIEDNGRKTLVQYLKFITGTAAAKRMEATPHVASEAAENLRVEVAQIEGIQGDRFSTLFPGGDFKEQPDDVFQPVGIEFVDQLCGGGLLQGEVVGHAAPIGSGKTTLVMQLVWSRAAQVIMHQQRIQALDGGDPGPVDYDRCPKIYVFSYEKVENLLASYISCAARIPREAALTAMMGGGIMTIDPSSSALANYKPYEVSMFGEDIKAAEKGERPFPKGELERFQFAVEVTDKLIQVVDFSGHREDLREWSAEQTIGMRRYIEAHQQHVHKTGVNFVALDFVGAMLGVAVSEGKIREDSLHYHTKSTPLLLGRDVGAAFGCPVWAAQQLNPEENEKKQGSVPNPSKASGSRMFLEFCSVGFASGVLTADNVAVFALGKNRRKQTAGSQYNLGQLDSQFARWKRADGFVFRDNMVLSRADVATAKLPPTARKGAVQPAGGFGARVD